MHAACVGASLLALPPSAEGRSATASDTRPLVADATTVRVRLLRLTRPRTFTFVADATATVRSSAEGAVLARIPAGASLTVAVQNGQVTLTQGADRWQAPTLHLDAEAFTVVLPTSGRDSRRRYSGTLRLDDDPAAPGTLRLIHTTDMEAYLSLIHI